VGLGRGERVEVGQKREIEGPWGILSEEQVAFTEISDLTVSTNYEIGSQPKLFARMAWSQGFYSSNGILRKKNMTGNNIFKKFP